MEQTAANASHQLDVDAEVERHFRFNAVANVLDGVFFWFGSGFLAPSTVLALYVNNLTDSTLLIGLLSTISSAGWFLPQLFTANVVERLPRKKYMVVNIGLFTERLPVVLLVPASLLALRSPALALVAFFLLYTWYTVGAGAVAVGWQDMYAKIVPAARRARLFGFSNTLGMGAGILAGAIVPRLLESTRFPIGFTITFAIAAVLMVASWVSLAIIREPRGSTSHAAGTQREYWRRLPGILRGDTNFVRLLISQIVANFGSMATGFLAIYTVERWQLSDAQAGAFTVSLLLGQAVTNLPFGVLADRRGHKSVLEIGMLLGAAAAGVALLAPNPTWFHVVFVLTGASFTAFYQSGMMIAFEFGSPEVRPTYIGLNSTARGAAAAVAPIVGGWLIGSAGYPTLFALSLIVGLVGFVLMRWTVRDPRRVEG